MKPARNNPSTFSLPRARILRGKHAFDAVFKQGRTLSSGLVSFRYLLLPETSDIQLFGFAARKKLGNAVVRNQLRRYLRESFRLQQALFLNACAAGNTGLHGVFSAQSADLDFHTTHAAVEAIARQLSSRIPVLNS